MLANLLVFLSVGHRRPHQAKPPAEAFIGYGGVAVREAVRDGADWFVNDFGPLIETLKESGETAENPPQ